MALHALVGGRAAANAAQRINVTCLQHDGFWTVSRSNKAPVSSLLYGLIRRTPLPAVLLLCMASCGVDHGAPSGAVQQAEINPAEAETSEDTAGTGAHALPSAPLSLLPGTDLAALASRLDRMELSRSSALQEARAAEATLHARELDRFPRLTPTATAPLRGAAGASVGLSLEQSIWDGGRVRAQLTTAELEVMEAYLNAWRDRNQAIYDGLVALVEIVRAEARLAALSDLSEELRALNDLLETRLEGGIADRGEVLKMASEQQEVERRIVFDRSALRRTLTDLFRLLPDDAEIPELPDAEELIHQCTRSWPDAETPAEALTLTNIALAEAAADAIRARRFPRLVLSAGMSYSQTGSTEPAVGLRLDASDMLGLGRSDDIAAADASVSAAEAAFARISADVTAELLQLEEDYVGLQQDLEVLQELLQRNEETLALHDEQLGIGASQFIAKIDFLGERADTLIALADVQADIVLNCLKSSQIRGLLAPFGGFHEQP